MGALKQADDLERAGALDLLKYLRELRSVRESGRRKTLGGLWAVILVILGSVGTAFFSWITGKHP